MITCTECDELFAQKNCYKMWKNSLKPFKFVYADKKFTIAPVECDMRFHKLFIQINSNGRNFVIYHKPVAINLNIESSPKYVNAPIKNSCFICRAYCETICACCQQIYVCSNECASTDHNEFLYHGCTICGKTGAIPCVNCLQHKICSRDCAKKHAKKCISACSHCYTKTTKKRCKRCGLNVYCNRECQTQDWKNHKLVCGRQFQEPQFQYN
jgi:hypothetical protein